MKKAEVSILDYGYGNAGAVANMFRKLGIDIIHLNRLDNQLKDFSEKLENEEIQIYDIDFSFLKGHVHE